MSELFNPTQVVIFVEAFDNIQNTAHKIAESKGFWDGPQNQGEKIALMHAELSEALEALRHDNPPDKHCPDYDSASIELADTIIRIMDFAERYSLPLSSALLAKVEFNAERPHKHGKQF